MKQFGVCLALATLVLGLVASEAAFGRGGPSHRGHFNHRPLHHHHHGRVGVFIGAPIVLGGWWWHRPPPPYYYYPPAAVAPAYIEQADEEAAPPADRWWYYCAQAKMYYPYVKECPGGWQRVAPQPPS